MTALSPILADDYKDAPYWWESAPRPKLPDSTLPKHVDVLVVGSGYTGLNAALQTARAGRSTLVVEAEACGHGCSSRNGGQIGTSFKPSLKRLERKFGKKASIEMIQEGHRALRYLKRLIAEEGIECDLSSCGRFLASHNRKAHEKLARDYARLPPEIAIEHHMIPPAELHGEIGSDLFYGGCVLPEHGSIHPGKYHLELLRLATQSGATVIDRCPVTSIDRDGKAFRVQTRNGAVSARDVVLATNGYTGEQFPWHSRRLLPIGSFQIATEPLPPERIDALVPKRRVISDTRLIGNYFRLSPDHARLIFGGRVTFTEAESESGIHALHQQMLQVYPQLEGLRISHSWVGYVAYTIDVSPHIGQRDGVHYAMGYCGSGITLASYFGMRTGQKVLGSEQGDTGLDAIEFPTMPTALRNRFTLSAATRLLRAAERFV